MVFRRDSNKVDSFQRQMNALRQQIGDDDPNDAVDQDDDRYTHADRARQGRSASDEGYSFGSYPSPSAAGQSAAFGDSDAPAIPEMPQADQQVSVVAAGTSWQGEIDVQGSLHIYGKANGSLKATNDIWIADGADVDARVEADRIVIGGEVSGQVTAHSRFEALPSCDIQADIDAPIFVVHEGATINGGMTMKSTSTPIDIDGRDTRGRPGSIIQRRTRTTS